MGTFLKSNVIFKNMGFEMDENQINQNSEKEERALWNVHEVANFLGISVHSMRRVALAPPVGFPSPLFMCGRWFWKIAEMRRWANGENFNQGVTSSETPERSHQSSVQQGPNKTNRGRGRPRNRLGPNEIAKNEIANNAHRH